MPGGPPLRLALLALVLVTGCSSSASRPEADAPVDVPVPVVTEAATRSACADLVAALPDEVDPGVERRAVARGQTLTAAWGEPPVVLLCGVAPPDRPEEPVVVNGVAWSVRDIGAGFQWTSAGREVTVAVQIPDAYENGGEIINPLSGSVAQVLPTAAPSP